MSQQSCLIWGSVMSKKDRKFYESWREAKFHACNNCPEIDWFAFTAIGIKIRLAADGSYRHYLQPADAMKAMLDKSYPTQDDR
jgi:hypothetical protein